MTSGGPDRLSWRHCDPRERGGKQSRIHDVGLDCSASLAVTALKRKPSYEERVWLRPPAALCTALCGSQGAVDMALFAVAKEPFLRGFLKLENGVPSHDTFSRLFRCLDPIQFHAAFQRFMKSFSEQCQGVVAIDGKVLRRSFDHASGKSPLHMVSAWGCEQRMVLAKIATDAKSNEITAVPKLLEMFSLKGTTVTVDALNCQRDIARQIVEQGGDYVLALKGNQGTLNDDVVRFLDDPQSKASTAEPMVDGDHGRTETRTARVLTDIGWLQEDHHWPA